MLDIKAETLLAVHKEKNFTRAANSLNLTQPAVSNHIHLLEKEIGHPLCIRSQGEVSFTPEGEIATRYAAQLKDIYAEMRAELLERQKSPLRLKIGITRSIENNYILVHTLGQYTNINPKLNIAVVSRPIQQLYDMLDHYELDFVVADAVPEASPFSCRPLDTDVMVCLISCNNPLCRKEFITLEELKNERMIMWSPASPNRILFESSLNDIGESIRNFNVILELDSTTSIKQMVAKDVGVAILPRSIFSGAKKYTGIPIKDLSMAREICLIYQKSYSHMNVVEQFYGLYQRIAQERNVRFI